MPSIAHVTNFNLKHLFSPKSTRNPVFKEVHSYINTTLVRM